MTSRSSGYLILLSLTLAMGVQAAAPPGPEVTITPPVEELGTFYAGAQVCVTGTVMEASHVIVVVRGLAASETYNRIGRVGPIWVNTGKVTVSHVPALQFVFSSGPVESCLNRAEIEAQQLDLGSLRSYMQIHASAQDRDSIAHDFLALKAREGAYISKAGVIHLGAPDQGRIPFTLNFQMPRSAMPGKYQVSVIACRGGEVTGKAERDLPVVEVGIPALVGKLAREHAPLYGAISVFLAIAAGLGIDFVTARLLNRKAPTP